MTPASCNSLPVVVLGRRGPCTQQGPPGNGHERRQGNPSDSRDALPTAPARGSGRGDLSRRPGAGEEGGPRPAGGGRQTQAGAEYVRRAAGGMKGAGRQLRLQLHAPAPAPARSGSLGVPRGRRGLRTPPEPRELGAWTQEGVWSVRWGRGGGSSGRSPSRCRRRSRQGRRRQADRATPREVLETPGAASVQVSAPPAQQPDQPQGWGAGWSRQAVRSARAGLRGAGARGRAASRPQSSPGRNTAPSALFLHPSGFLSRRLQAFPSSGW